MGKAGAKRYFSQRVERHIKERQEKKRKAREKKFGKPREYSARDAASGKGRRKGGVTAAEKLAVETLVRDMPQEITKNQVEHLAAAMLRSPETIQALITSAREKFVQNATKYVEAHMEAVEGALAKGEHEVAAKHAEWAMEHVSHEGHRVIDIVNPKASPQGPQLVVGVQVGGMPVPEDPL